MRRIDWQVFRPVKTERGGRGHSQRVPVLTWSDRALEALQVVSSANVDPVEVWVADAAPYGVTLSFAPTSPDILAHGVIANFAAQLEMLAMLRPLVQFSDLLNDHVQLPTIRALFALIRDYFVEKRADARTALVPPIPSTAPSASAFPLHSDIFGAERLMNVFDNVPHDGTGAALFLPVDAVRTCLMEAGAPDDVIRNVVALVKREHGTQDGFDDLMELLYSPGASWSAAFADLGRQRCYSFSPQRGDGYLLDDTKILHGRDAVSATVSSDRLARLVFSTRPLPSVASEGRRRTSIAAAPSKATILARQVVSTTKTAINVKSTKSVKAVTHMKSLHNPNVAKDCQEVEKVGIVDSMKRTQ